MRTSTELSSRERVLCALDGQPTDRIPIGMICAGIHPSIMPDLNRIVMQETGRTADDYLDDLVDIASIGPDYVGPTRKAGEDEWGVVRKAVSYGSGEYSEIEYYPLADASSPADIVRHTWPEAAWWDYDVLPEKIDRARGKAIIAGHANIFETAWYMRGMERMMMDMVLNPELVHAVMERVTVSYVAQVERMLAAAPGKIDFIFTADDIAGQNGLLMSLDMWHEFIRPYHERLNTTIHAHGARVVYHSDGAVMEAAGGLAAMGVDVLEALQFNAAGMDPEKLKAEHGHHLRFTGGVCVQNTLPFGTPDDVAAEVRHLIRTLGRGGGYILGPSHVIQAGTPARNVFTMFETARTCPLPDGLPGK